MAKDLAFGGKALRRLLKQLDKPQELEHEYAEAILDQAVRNAASKPTPQARMAAANMDVSGSTIAPSAGGPAAEVAIGSEFGSTLFPQFHHSPAPAGLWLYPATRDEDVLKLADKSLEEILQAAVRGL